MIVFRGSSAGGAALAMGIHRQAVSPHFEHGPRGSAKHDPPGGVSRLPGSVARRL